MVYAEKRGQRACCGARRSQRKPLDAVDRTWGVALSEYLHLSISFSKIIDLKQVGIGKRRLRGCPSVGRSSVPCSQVDPSGEQR